MSECKDCCDPDCSGNHCEICGDTDCSGIDFECDVETIKRIITKGDYSDEVHGWHWLREMETRLTRALHMAKLWKRCAKKWFSYDWHKDYIRAELAKVKAERDALKDEIRELKRDLKNAQRLINYGRIT